MLMLAVAILAIKAVAGSSQEPAPSSLPALESPPPAHANITDMVQAVSNQQLAASVGQALQSSGKLRHYRVDINVAGGQVELLGRVADLGQKEEAVRLARAVSGVTRVRDLLVVGAGGGIIRVENVPPVELGPPPKKYEPATPTAPDSAVLPFVQGLPPGCLPPGCAMPPPGCMYPNEPAPIGSSVPNDVYNRPPPLPPYAWPTYAPYNNYSRVAYPTIYPQDAWPGIGPFYPFPKVPTGWRTVTLSWQDGYWWYGRGVSGHDWWRVRYK